MEIVIIIVLILLNGIFSMSEIALISARKSSLSTEAKRGSKASKRTLKLAEEPDRFLSTIQIGITLIGILTGLYSGAALADDLGHKLSSAGIPETYARETAQAIIVIAVTYLTLVLGELIPKRIGLSAPERIAKATSMPMMILSVVAAPLVWILSKSTSGIIKLLGIKGEASKVTEEEIKMMIQAGTEGGEVQEVEQDIVERVFSLGDRRVESIMTHRGEMVWIDRGADRKSIAETVRANPHNVYPVADGSLDKVTGVIFLKDLFTHIDEQNFNLDIITVPASFIPENMTVYKTLELLRTRQTGHSIVYDEFGSTQGIVTLRDIFEALVGSMPEHGDEQEIIPREDGSWLVDGQISFYDFLTHFEQEYLYADHQHNTLSGLMLEKLGHIPHTGEKLSWKTFSFEVMDMDGARIDKVLVKTTTDRDEDS